MSDSDDTPKEPDQQPTVAWNPEAGEAAPDSSSAEEDEEGEGGHQGPEESGPAEESPEDSEGSGEEGAPQATVAWSPEEVAERTEDRAAADEEGAARAEQAEDPLVGKLLRGKWRVLERLGAGGYGTVYKVKDEKGGWIEALKILAVDRIGGSEAQVVRKRFLREAQIMKRLGAESPHIVALSTYEEDIDAGMVYFLMEFVEGRSLAEVLREEGPVSVDRTLELALQVCEALIVAHQGEDSVVHRDLKLENLMLTRDRSGQEIVKVLDFGIAQLAEQDPDSRLTQAGSLGTPGFAAPEQIRAESVDARTDLFAFGVILYALLTGRDPWLGNPAWESTHQVYDLMAASERGQVRPMAETAVEIPPAMEGVVLRLLRRDPDQRFQSARELKEVLARLLSGEDVAAGAMLRVLADRDGVDVEVRSGRRTVARGTTPLLAADLTPGAYRIRVTDERFEPVETSVELGAGAIEDLTVVTHPRKAGVGATLRRRAGTVAVVVVLSLSAAALVLVRPWGRTLPLTDFTTRAASGEVTDVRLGPGGLEGALEVAFLPAPVRVPLEEGERAPAVEQLRSEGVGVDTSWEVDRLIRLAVRAQSEMRYFGEGGGSVREYARRAAALEPESGAARSLLLKVGERMAWDAEAALREGSPEAARELIRECLELVPDHPRCARVRDEL